MHLEPSDPTTVPFKTRLCWLLLRNWSREVQQCIEELTRCFLFIILKVTLSELDLLLLVETVYISQLTVVLAAVIFWPASIYIFFLNTSSTEMFSLNEVNVNSTEQSSPPQHALYFIQKLCLWEFFSWSDESTSFSWFYLTTRQKFLTFRKWKTWCLQTRKWSLSDLYHTPKYLHSIQIDWVFLIWSSAHTAVYPICTF